MDNQLARIGEQLAELVAATKQQTDIIRETSKDASDQWTDESWKQPNFKGAKRTLEISVNEDVFKAAGMKAFIHGQTKQEGKNLERVIEYLLWRFADAPPELVDSLASVEGRTTLPK